MTDWQPMTTAPRNGTAIQARIPGHGSDFIIGPGDDLLDSKGNPCGGWHIVEDQEPPDCWTEGVCWEQNEDGVRSVPPSEWKALKR